MAMRAFVRVVDAGTFTRASDLLGMPNSTVTKLIQELERHLRVKLLQRTTRRVSVTPEGALYYDKAMQLLADLDDMDTGFIANQQRPRGRLRIDMGSSIATSVLIPALPEFQARFPEIEIDVGVSDRMADLVADNIDCVIRGGASQDPSLVARPIGATGWVTCATPAYLAAHGVPRHPDDLKSGHHVVSYVATHSNRAVPLRFAIDGVEVACKTSALVRVNESNAHAAAALAGLGIVQTFTYMVKAHLASGALVPVLAQFQPAPYPFFVVFPQNRYVSNRQRVFIDWLVDRFPSMLN